MISMKGHLGLQKILVMRSSLKTVREDKILIIQVINKNSNFR